MTYSYSTEVMTLNPLNFFRITQYYAVATDFELLAPHFGSALQKFFIVETVKIKNEILLYKKQEKQNA